MTKCVVADCESPKHPKAGGGMCHLHYWREYRARRRTELDENYRTWRKAKGSRWANMGDAERSAYRTSNAARRAMRRGAESFRVTDHDLSRAIRRSGHRCCYCGETYVVRSWDHVTPLTAGGRHSVGNLSPACERCNKSKGSAYVMEWRMALLRGQAVRRRRIPTPLSDYRGVD